MDERDGQGSDNNFLYIKVGGRRSPLRLYNETQKGREHPKSQNRRPLHEIDEKLGETHQCIAGSTILSIILPCD